MVGLLAYAKRVLAKRKETTTRRMNEREPS